MSFISTKTYGHNLGLSCCFRQWKAEDSHCRFLHGYALQISLKFEADALDTRNWVLDFGGFKDLKKALEDMFDHKTLVARDDPKVSIFRELQIAGIIDLVEVEATGCERFAEMVAKAVIAWMSIHEHHDRVRLIEVEVREHGANSAIWRP